MKNTDRNLDDIFAAARNEQPVLSEENAREIIRTSEHMQPSFTLFSTKGIIMSTIGLSLAAFIGYLAFAGSPKTNQPNHISAIVPQTRNLLNHPTEESKNIEPPQAKKLVINTDDDKNLPHKPIISVPMKVTGITPVVLPEEKFSKMGIVKKADGTVSFYQKNDRGEVTAFNFPKNSWGIQLELDDQNNDNKMPMDVKAIPAFSPLIVTDTKGNKRLMQFTHKDDEVLWTNMRIESRKDEDDADLDQFDNEEYDPQINVRSDSGRNVISIQNNKINIETNVEKSDEKPPHSHVSVSVNANAMRTDTMANGAHRHIIISKKELKDNLLHSLPGKILDSIMRVAGSSIQKVEKEMKSINMDSIYNSANESLRQAQEELKKINMDSIFKEAGKSFKNASEQLKNLNLDSIMKSANEHMKEADKVMQERCAELNHLVPILVRTSTKESYSKEENITYDDGLIFWYEPQDSVSNILPVAEMKKEAVTPINNFSVINQPIIYPNPAHANATIRFSLSEPRTVAFSIHDLLGKRVMEGGNLTASAAGEFEKELDASELPSGVYLLVMTTDKGEQMTERLAIEK